MTDKRKLYILDTNVLIADPDCIFKFEEHDIFLAHTVLEELDGLKKGVENVARSARSANRNIESVISDDDSKPKRKCVYSHCYSIDEAHGLGMVIFEPINADTLSQKKETYGDNGILLSVIKITDEIEKNKAIYGYDSVVLVSKDINMRIKAKNLGLIVEDYLNDHVVSDSSMLPSGVHKFSGKEIECMASSYDNGSRKITLRLSEEISIEDIFINEFLEWEGRHYKVCQISEKDVECLEIENYKSKDFIWGINALNDEQNLAMNLLMDPLINLVSLLGPAGTGKTLITLAAALENIIENKLYDETIITRATVGASHEIGFLPGTEEEKLTPWMGAFFDNLEILSLDVKDDAQTQFTDLIKIKSINFMRGRSFKTKFIIIDEGQNLTAKEVKLLLTRAGQGTKVVIMGNLAQIDSPYVNEVSSGLTYALERLKNLKISGHLILKESVRSELAEAAENRL